METVGTSVPRGASKCPGAHVLSCTSEYSTPSEAPGVSTVGLGTKGPRRSEFLREADRPSLVAKSLHFRDESTSRREGSFPGDKIMRKVSTVGLPRIVTSGGIKSLWELVQAPRLRLGELKIRRIDPARK